MNLATKVLSTWICGVRTIKTIGMLMVSTSLMFAQDVESSNAQSWTFSGRVQLQNLINTNTEANDDRTNNGFRIRRGRLQTKAKITDQVSAKIQIEVRDNSPRLKDAEAKIKMFGSSHLRVGQFKVPVWREELRSSGKLFLVERSEAAEFLADNLLSARHVGMEIGGSINDNISYAMNYSNGAGEGVREDAGRSKNSSTNNGKMISGRVNFSAGDKLEFGISAVSNSRGIQFDTLDNQGRVTLIAPDVGIYLSKNTAIEAGVALGSISSDFTGGSENTSFMVFDISGRTKKSIEANENLGGLDAIGFAAGFSFVDPNSDIDMDEASYFRFGPVLNFGSKTYLQVNGEIEMPSADGADSVVKIRSQFTVNL